MASRTIIIGDVHGCFDEARELLSKLAASASDRVIFAGDLVDRGPQSRACVELAMRHEAILGNHEEKHLQQRHSREGKLSPDHLNTRQQLEDAHFDWMAALPTFIALPEFGAAVIHAGALPGIPIAKQDPYHLLHAQCVKPPARKSYWPSKAPADFTFWTNHWRGPERLIFGHTVLSAPLVGPHAVGIDTGCVFGGSLTALVLPDWELVSVPARQSHRSDRGTVARYPIAEGVFAFS